MRSFLLGFLAAGLLTMPATAEVLMMKCNGYEDDREMLESPSVSDLMRQKRVENIKTTLDVSEGSSIEVAGHPQFEGTYDYLRQFERFGVYTYAYVHRDTGRLLKLEAGGDIKTHGMSIEMIDCGKSGAECQYNLHMKGSCKSVN